MFFLFFQEKKLLCCAEAAAWGGGGGLPEEHSSFSLKPLSQDWKATQETRIFSEGGWWLRRGGELKNRPIKAGRRQGARPKGAVTIGIHLAPVGRAKPTIQPFGAHGIIFLCLENGMVWLEVTPIDPPAGRCVNELHCKKSICCRLSCKKCSSTLIKINPFPVFAIRDE